MCFSFGMEGKDSIFSFVYLVYFKNTDKQNQCNFGHYQMNLIFAGAQFWQERN